MTKEYLTCSWCPMPMCNSGDPHDHRQFKRADAKQAFEQKEYDV